MGSTIPQNFEPLRQDKTTVLSNDRRNTLPRLKKTAQEFEAMLYQMMFKSMRATIQKNPMFHGGATEDTFQEMTDLETAKAIANARSFGLADAIVRDYKKYITDTDQTETGVSNAAGSEKSADPKQAEKAAKSEQKLSSFEKQARAALSEPSGTAEGMLPNWGGNANRPSVNTRPGAVAKKAYASAGK